MNKIYALLLGGLLCGYNAVAQNNLKRCASHEHLQEQLAQDPSLQSRMDQIEALTQKYLRENGAKNRNGAIVTIPVVVHVVWNTTSQNISDCQIQSQIDVLNEDYRKLNADRINTPSVFTGVAADAEIQFVLAKRDPNGNATNGITRTKTKNKQFSANDAIKYTSQGGHDAWDTRYYLNFWTAPKLVSYGQQLLGYGQFPGGSRTTDGVVMAYAAFGSRAKCPSGVYYSGYDLGRTTTHEVGHLLNLRHIWGDATCGDDLVSDTPTQQASNYGCPTFPHKTCNNNGDMSMNFMDYTDDPCMYMFTTGQAARMNATLTPGGYHYELTTSLGGTAPSGSVTTTPTTDPEPTTKPGKGNPHNNRGLSLAGKVFPNPVTAEMNVGYTISNDQTNVQVEIYNLVGKLVKTYDLGSQAAGEHVFTISPDEDRTFGSLVNGMYLCKIKGADQGQLIRFVIEK